VTTLLIVRHAESTWNAEGRWQGHADPPLSLLGIEQAEVAGRRLGESVTFDLVVTSDLARASMTGAILVGQPRRTMDGSVVLGGEFDPESPVPLVTDRGLREIDVGEWTGLTRVEIEAQWPGALARHDAGRLDRVPGGESRREFDIRVASAVRFLVSLVESRRAGEVLVVTHGGVVKSIARSAGLEEPRISHLSGYRASLVAGDLCLEAPVNLIMELRPDSSAAAS
jgi:broad specificity phosphatase PhoE